MKTLSAIGIAALLIVALMLGCAPTPSQGECKLPPVHVIVVSADADGQPVLKIDGKVDDDVHVCLGDRVVWVLSGPDRELFVDFTSTVGAPFPGPKKKTSNKNVINVRIGGPDAKRGTDYKYDVGFTNGKSRDPQIIVE